MISAALMPVLLALVLAHLVGDFLLQRLAVIEGKVERRARAYMEHGLVHVLCLWLAWLLFVPATLLDAWVWTGFGVIVLTHLVVDWVKSTRGPGGGPLTGAGPFLADQVFHLLVLAGVAWWLAGDAATARWLAALWQSHRMTVGVVFGAYLLAVFGTGYFNALLLKSLTPPQAPGLARAGLYIGWLERFLMLTAVLLQAYAALGLVLAAKSVFRFDAIRQQRASAEYFLIGTLISVTEVVLVGALALLLLTGLGAL